VKEFFMLPDEVLTYVGNLPYMRIDAAWMFYDFITGNRLSTGLELGFFHGVSTAYLAGAIQDVGPGSLTTVDRMDACERMPNVESILQKAGLAGFVRVYYEPKSFNWRLMKLLEEQCDESFDFCYIDGGHTWYDTGFAFCLVARLLKPGGWVIFDDLYFTFRQSSLREKPWVKRMPEEEQVMPQVQQVFELLVEKDPQFGSFRRLGRFAFAQKRTAAAVGAKPANQEDILLSRAFEHARTDPAFRQALLHSPSHTLADYSGQSPAEFHHLRIVDTGALAPRSSQMLDSGEKIVPLERF
jgi:predicted O-methyltransferase YrrM